jgi:hypothetical protein
MPRTSPEEQLEIDALKTRLDKIKLDTFEYLKTFVNAAEPDLRTSGYRTREEAFTSIMRRRMNEIEATIRKHEARWPHN